LKLFCYKLNSKYVFPGFFIILIIKRIIRYIEHYGIRRRNMA
jgi:hypothetical protein